MKPYSKISFETMNVHRFSPFHLDYRSYIRLDPFDPKERFHLDNRVFANYSFYIKSFIPTPGKISLLLLVVVVGAKLFIGGLCFEY